MTTHYTPDALDTFEMSTALRFLLHHMGPEVRGKMMGSLPVIYAKIYPAVTAERIEEYVERAIEEARS